MKMKQLQLDLRRRLNGLIYLASARAPLAEHLLDSADRQRLASFTTTDRKNQWLRGRRALSAVAAKLDIETRLSALNPPCPGISLTHNGRISIAAGISTAQGIGIDFESWRQIEPAMMRWFLTETEQNQLLVPSNFTRLRLWSVKQALFKASSANQGLLLTDFKIDEVAVMTGHARNCSRGNSELRYTSFMLRQGLLSIAIED
jgi:4'-phosphopantetheinyl transferase EntD